MGSSIASRIVTAGLLALVAARADAAGETAVAAFGVFGPGPGENRAAVLDLELRFPPSWHGIGAVVGAAASSEGGNYLRAGLGRDLPFAGRWNANVSVAAGAYIPGGGKRLGLGLELRSAIEVSYHLRPRLRCGLAYAHLSNAGLGNFNPGVETLTVTMALLPQRRR
jgi:hypothetical protein